ncbi:MAG: mechanosensitive ion channel family protein [Nitrospiraceae bacterium]
MKEFWEKGLLDPLELLARQVLSVLPSILAMSIIFAAGLLVAWTTSQTLERLLRVVGLDRLCDRLGITSALLRGGVKTDPSRLVGQAAYWLVMIFATVAALGALNLQPINDVAKSFLAYVPHLVTAGLILIAGWLLSNFVSQAVLIAAVNAGLPPARLVATCSRWGIQLLAVAMALEQLGIAQNIVVVGFGITLGGIVLAGAIAFGLGSKDLAKDYIERGLSIRSRERGTDDLRHL